MKLNQLIKIITEMKVKKEFQWISILVFVFFSITTISCTLTQDEYRIQAWERVKTINRLIVFTLSHA